MKYWNATMRVTFGCTPIAGGCANCWAAAETNMRQYNPLVAERYRGLLRNGTGGTPCFNGTVRLNEKFYWAPLHTKRPRAWQIWNDLFHKDVPDKRVAEVVTIARMRPQHTFICLTKRPARAAELPDRLYFEYPTNFYIGVSVSSHIDGDMLDVLKSIEAPSKIISFEPATGHADFTASCRDPALKCIIAGGETGPRAHVRDCPEDVIRACRNTCLDSGVLFFFKAWGSKRPGRTLDDRTWDELPWTL
jgi:protein gp37